MADSNTPKPYEALHAGLKNLFGIYEITDYMPCIVEAMLRFLYNFDYETDASGESSQLHFHVRVYAIAKQYNITSLEALAKAKFETLAKKEWDKIDYEVISAAYDATGDKDPLREIIITIACEHAKKLVKNPDFKNVVEAVGPFGADLAERLAETSGYPHKYKVYRCPECSMDVVGDFQDGKYYTCNYCSCQYTDWTVHIKK